MTAPRIGVQLHPQHTSMDDLRAAWRTADAAGLDSIWVWDHFFPLYGPPGGAHFEGWSLLAAMAVETTRARIGVLVGCNSYRNPELLADMARTIDHLSGGRTYLGLGAGWFARDYEAYGYDFGTRGSRIDGLESALPRLRERLGQLTPPPVGPLPVLIGGRGERRTLQLVARHADAWNGFGPVDTWAHKSAVLDRWCDEVGRDPGQIERTVLLNDGDDLDTADAFVDAGATHVIVGLGHPFDLDPVLAVAERLRGRA